MKAQGVDVDVVEKRLNLKLVEKVESELSELQKSVLNLIRDGVEPNEIGYYTNDINYVVIGKQLGIEEADVKEIVWQLNDMKLIRCFVAQAHVTGYDSFNVRPWLEPEQSK